VKILLIRLRQIGDVVFTTPAVRALREQFPDAQITYVVEPAATPIVAGSLAIDELIVAPRARGFSGLSADVRLGWRLRRQAFDVAIDFHGGPRASLLTWLSRAPIRIGYEVVGRSWMYTRVVARPRTLRPRHSVENQWDLLESLHTAPPDRARYPVEMALDTRAAALVAARLRRDGAHAGDRLIVIHVSAGNPFRRWPAASFTEVAARLTMDRPDTRVIVTSGPSERDAAERVVADARARIPASDRERVVAWGDDFSLVELRALVERAALYIGGDSGPMHIAATSPVPIVSLYGPTLPARSAPWRAERWPVEAVEVTGLSCRPCDQRICAPGDFRCLTGIEPRAVLDAALRLLARNG
jgi:lipopolysaccharide heptosyltransferase II